MKKHFLLYPLLMVIQIELHAKPEFVNYDVISTRCLKGANDTIWICTDEGIIIRNNSGKFLGAFTTENGLVNNNVYAFAIDQDGNKWFGTWQSVSKFDGTNWTTYDTTNGLIDNRVMAIAIDQEGNKWFGTYGGGISKFDGTNWTTYDTTNGLISNIILSIAIDQEGNKWFGTYDRGVMKYNDSTWVFFLDSLLIEDIEIDLDGNVWVA